MNARVALLKLGLGLIAVSTFVYFDFFSKSATAKLITSWYFATFIVGSMTTHEEDQMLLALPRRVWRALPRRYRERQARKKAERVMAWFKALPKEQQRAIFDQALKRLNGE